MAGGRQLAHIGSFTSEGGAGVITAGFDPRTGALTPLSATDAVSDPSFLAADAPSGMLYAVSEGEEGAAAAFRIRADGLEPVGSPVPVGGSGPTHLALAAGHLHTANYVSGSVSTLPLAADGSLTGATSLLRHTGSGPNADRQEGPHAHQVQPDPSGRWIVSVDLGTDEVRVCALNDGALDVHAATRLRPGSGPRHLVFHPRGHRAYVLHELTPAVTVCRWDADRGELEPLRETGILPAGAEGGTAYGSGIVISPDGRLLWTAIRGHDSISTLTLDDAGDAPELTANAPCGGRWPRDLAIDPAGTHMYAANQHSGDVVWFDVDERTGELTRAGSIAAPAASCVVFS
ncbi:lactonase family protein [Streptomyces sp. A7024]|uniref:Lactonase family protein n=1 Tax=Streptomyces coryli TaxID=1128680 RepID=A0A6G4TWV2_9ACTN|nr:lactonase family protein [Streptomyces coryli]NGN64455.1 lactonase family protein [Streptomyces coryli]